MAETPRKALGIQIDAVRQRLLVNAETQEIAKNLGMELAEYVEMILDYAQHPEKEPILQVLDDETVASLGGEVPSTADVKAWLQAVQDGEIDLNVQADVVADAVELKSAEEDRKKKLSAAIGGTTTRSGPSVAPPVKPAGAKADSGAGSVLKQQLLAQRSAAHQKVAGKAQSTQPKPKGGR